MFDFTFPYEKFAQFSGASTLTDSRSSLPFLGRLDEQRLRTILASPMTEPTAFMRGSVRPEAAAIASIRNATAGSGSGSLSEMSGDDFNALVRLLEDEQRRRQT